MLRRPVRSSLPSRKILFLAIAGARSTTWQGAHAQQLEEITITAERRELLLQDTPISVMAFSGPGVPPIGSLRSCSRGFVCAVTGVTAPARRAIAQARRATMRRRQADDMGARATG